MPLKEYREKRRFDKTPEPAGAEKPKQGAKGVFVVQMHDASHLHYDFRLEIGGVLVSWAVPKGPSLNPAEKRLAMMTEDHPLEYANFEGTIPEGNYGAGTVMVWDTGTFEPEGGEPAAIQLARGDLKFTLRGRKLCGSFVLVHSGARSADPRRAKQWLLIKHRDECARRDWNLDEQAWSVLTGRTMEEIAAGRPAKKRAGG
jgi:bifunctional non-homologous end joining protein LigD